MESSSNSCDEINIETDKWMNVLAEDNPEEVEVIIEIPKDSRVKYEYDKETQRIVCDRILTTPFSYFFNYGYLPNTLSEDGDPMDAIVLMEDALFPGCSIRCRILGVLETKDEKGEDPKLILCPTSKIDPGYEHWRDILDVSVALLNKLKHFFSHYKDLEEGKFVEVGHLLGKEDAKQMVLASRIHYYSQLIDENI
jgi:inorganic pyrophosphatase